MTETGLRNERHLSMHDLVARINAGDIDTVVVAFTDMQGRLQGKRLQSALDSVSRARGPAMHRQADSRFHLTIAAVTGSPRIIESVTAVQSTLHEMLSAIPVLDASIAHSDTQHARIVSAILAGRADRAHRVMEEHCDDTGALLRGLLG